MQFIKPGININFIGKRKIAFAISIVLIILGMVSLIIHKGPKYGIDFAGGTVIQVKFTAAATINDIKSGLKSIGLDKSSVQSFGEHDTNEFLIRTDIIETDENFSNTLQQALKTSTENDIEIRRIEMVGPQVGKDLQEKALFAMFYALLFITIYISGRFELKWGLSGVMAAALMTAVYVFTKFNVSIPFLIGTALIISLILFWFLELKYAMGAIVALIHDITITVGIFFIFDKEFTLPIIAALLTIIGYSLNDTIIVFDRIRENMRKHHKEPLDTIINKSINETLSRTLLTSLTTFMQVRSCWHGKIRGKNRDSGRFMWQFIKIAGISVFVGICLSACAMVPAANDNELLILQNQADNTNQKIEELNHRMSVMQFMLDNHQKTIHDLKKRNVQKTRQALTVTEIQPVSSPSGKMTQAAPVPANAVTLLPPELSSTAIKAASEPAKTPKQLYDEALSTYKRKAYTSALSLFDSFMAQYPTHDLTDNALYWSGECLYSQKKFSEAIPFFKKIIETYPRGGKAPDAMLKVGYTYLNLDDPPKAKYYFKEVIKSYPFSSASEKAEQKLKQIR